MTVGIVGLGLIGGSFARAYTIAGHRVLAREINESVFKFAMLTGSVQGELTEDEMKDCDLILLCTYPGAAVEFMEKEGPFFGSKPVVIDCCGTKRNVSYIRLYEKVKELLAPAGFSSITVTTSEKHDEIIAYTSQLAHVVSGAYVKSPTSRAHKGLSAGSYKDMTRVAWLSPEMWTELCMDNKDNLIKEVDTLISNLQAYRDALAEGDSEKLKDLFSEGRRIKEEVDG